MKIAMMVGSLSKESHNAGLAKAMIANAPENMEFVELDIRDLPLYNRDFDLDYPEVARELKRQVEDADGLIILTPEHNRMYSAAIANALEWLSRPWGTGSLRAKPVYIGGAAVSPVGTAVAQTHLRATLDFQDALLMNQPELYLDYSHFPVSPDGEVENPATTQFIASALASFHDFIEKHGDRSEQQHTEF